MLLAATGSGVYGFSPTRDNGWEASLKALEGKDVTAIATTEGRLLATPHGVGLQESTDGGVTWATLLEGVNARCLAFGPAGALYLGADPAAIYKGRMAALPEALEGRRPPSNGFEELAALRQLPSVPAWNFPNQPHLGNIHALAFSPRDPERIYAAVEVGGVIVSSDGGKTWVERREGIHLDVHAIASAPGEQEDVLYTATGQGFFRSPNAGRTWESCCDGFASLYLAPLAVHPARPAVVFTAATQGRPRYWRGREGGARCTIYRSENAGATWRPAMGGLPDTLPAAVSVLAVDPSGGETVYAGSADGRLFVSEHLGASWRTLAEDLPPVHGLAFA